MTERRSSADALHARPLVRLAALMLLVAAVVGTWAPGALGQTDSEGPGDTADPAGDTADPAGDTADPGW